MHPSVTFVAIMKYAYFVSPVPSSLRTPLHFNYYTVPSKPKAPLTILTTNVPGLILCITVSTDASEYITQNKETLRLT